MYYFQKKKLQNITIGLVDSTLNREIYESFLLYYNQISQGNSQNKCKIYYQQLFSLQYYFFGIMFLLTNANISNI